MGLVMEEYIMEYAAFQSGEARDSSADKKRIGIRELSMYLCRAR